MTSANPLKLNQRRLVNYLIAIISLGLILAGAAIFFHIQYFYWRNNHVGAQLSLKEKLLINQARQHPGQLNCSPPPQNNSEPQPAGILSIPAIGLANAPVVQGTTDSQLNVAIGHDPASVWPGQPGTAVLSAHDVTWFSKIPSLKDGDLIYYETPCATYSFKVTGHKIVSAGSMPVNTPNATLILDTCWPTNALYLTNYRYEVFATLISYSPSGSPTGSALRPHAILEVPAPVSLAAANQLNFPYIPFPLGTYTIQGNPSQAWEQSTATTDTELATLSIYQDAIYSLTHQRPDYWHDIAPNVSYAQGSPLFGAKIRYVSAVDPYFTVNGSTVINVGINTTIYIYDVSQTGYYQLSMQATVKNHYLYITSWQMSQK